MKKNGRKILYQRKRKRKLTSAVPVDTKRNWSKCHDSYILHCVQYFFLVCRVLSRFPSGEHRTLGKRKVLLLCKLSLPLSSTFWQPKQRNEAGVCRNLFGSSGPKMDRGGFGWKDVEKGREREGGRVSRRECYCWRSTNEGEGRGGEAEKGGEGGSPDPRTSIISPVVPRGQRLLLLPTVLITLENRGEGERRGGTTFTCFFNGFCAALLLTAWSYRELLLITSHTWLHTHTHTHTHTYTHTHNSGRGPAALTTWQLPLPPSLSLSSSV